MSRGHWNSYLELLPTNLKTECNEYVRWQDKHYCVFGKLILLRGLEAIGLGALQLGELKYTEFEKPYLTGNIDFNISHSGGHIICAIAENIKLGIDIERINEIDFSDYTQVMTTNQWNEINRSKNPLHTFYRFWTIKESIMKADGRGFRIDPKDISIKENIGRHKSSTWYLTEIDISNEVCTCLATSPTDVSIQIEEVDFYYGN